MERVALHKTLILAFHLSTLGSILGECLQNRVSRAKTALDEAESLLSRMYLPFYAHKA